LTQNILQSQLKSSPIYYDVTYRGQTDGGMKAEISYINPNGSHDLVAIVHDTTKGAVPFDINAHCLYM
jgi:hypothetical protein